MDVVVYIQDDDSFPYEHAMCKISNVHKEAKPSFSARFAVYDIFACAGKRMPIFNVILTSVTYY
jgi:hypothetical protein